MSTVIEAARTRLIDESELGTEETWSEATEVVSEEE